MSTKTVRAIIPVLGLRANQIAELTDTPFLQAVLKRGWLEAVTKADLKQAQAKVGGPELPSAVDPDITKTGE